VLYLLAHTDSFHEKSAINLLAKMYSFTYFKSLLAYDFESGFRQQFNNLTRIRRVVAKYFACEDSKITNKLKRAILQPKP